jgi:hypothetical protein
MKENKNKSHQVKNSMTNTSMVKLIANLEQKGEEEK